MLSSRLRSTSFILYIAGVLSGITVCYFMSESETVCPDGTVTEPLRLSGSDIRRDFQKLPTSELARDSQRFTTSGQTRHSPVVFIGGHPRSGTTLMRVLLDSHPSFNCGQETHIIPDLLTLRRKFSRGRGLNRLREASVDLETINTTIAYSILDIIKSHGEASTRLCNKDPFTLKHIPYLARMFPKAQFILMVRDARAVVHSIRENNIRISHYPKADTEALRRWNKILEIMLRDCLSVRAERCKVVHYEKLVLKPRLVLQEILKFLRSPWSERVLNHTRYLDKTGGILLSKLERSTHQVRKPIYNDSLHLWMTSSSLNLPREELLAWAPIMATLGYIDIGNPPKYLNLKIKNP